MGRTVPSFRIVLEMEKKEWKPFRDALDKSEKKSFDEMWDIARNYVSACSNSVQLVPRQPIIISILFHHYKELMKCIREVEQIRGNRKVNNDNHYTSSSGSGDGGIIVMMMEQEKPLETYDEMVQEIEQEIIIHENIEIIEEEMFGTLDGYFRYCCG